VRLVAGLIIEGESGPPHCKGSARSGALWRFAALFSASRPSFSNAAASVVEELEADAPNLKPALVVCRLPRNRDALNEGELELAALFDDRALRLLLQLVNADATFRNVMRQGWFERVRTGSDRTRQDERG
jgi:hypothetical protein